jgi:D-alanyl-D-alanine carboxypeptidase (penicillin-binding protein 5/6)
MALRAGRGLAAFSCCLAALVLGVSPVVGVTHANAATVTAPPPHAWIVADAISGAILSEHDEHVALPPASTTKVMTALTAVERLPPNAMIHVTAQAANQPASKINMQVGQAWSFTDALASLLIVSANDSAWAIALQTSGTVQNFVKAETATATQLGLRDSTFADPAGLDDGNAYGGGPVMSAYDIAISTRNALSVPLLANLAGAPEFSFVGPGGIQHHLTNHNKLVSEHLYAGADGFKTGFTNKAGHTLIATATRNGRTLIAVVLDTVDAYGWAENLLDQGFSHSAAPGTDGSLPPVRVVTYAQRSAQLTGFRQLATGSAGSAGAALGSASPTTPTTTAAPTATSGHPTTANGAVGAPLGSAASTAAKKAGHGLSRKTIVIVVLLLVLALLYVLRVRAVRRARARRLARRREAREMMRRGSLPIVDGRYRTGTRVGKPVESHVQITREDPDRRAYGTR